MLCDNIKPNLNILRFVLDRVHADIKINNSIETNHLYYKDMSNIKTSLFSPHMHKVTFTA